MTLSIIKTNQNDPASVGTGSWKTSALPDMNSLDVESGGQKKPGKGLEWQGQGEHLPTNMHYFRILQPIGPMGWKVSPAPVESTRNSHPSLKGSGAHNLGYSYCVACSISSVFSLCASVCIISSAVSSTWQVLSSTMSHLLLKPSWWNFHFRYCSLQL